jgi:hypothetical protein
MNMTTIGYLSPEDLERYRYTRSRMELTFKAHPGFTVEEAVEAGVAYDRFMYEIAERYELDDEMQVLISRTNGRIAEKD